VRPRREHGVERGELRLQNVDIRERIAVGGREIDQEREDRRPADVAKEPVTHALAF
jgi:hypothetical protein